jgi:cysteinyl-tRNA synthetase
VDESTLTLAGRELPVIGRARMYVCGITPYDTTHLGHAATFVWADLAARVLGMTGVDVEVCRNITDVDEELLARAAEQHVAWRGLAAQQTYRFERDMAELKVAKPTYEPKSFDFVGEVASLAAVLLRRNAAYVREGSVYFRGAGTAEAAGLTRDQALALAAGRGGHPDDPLKDDPLDAVVWQHVGDGEPGWPSPWGRGRPGWHAECTAMALTTLGPGIDIHVGGADLAFPHHAVEAAQAEAAVDVRPFARSWLRVGAVMVDGQKMAKSAGNLVMVHDLLERWSPETLRLLILDRRWNEPWEFSEEALDGAASRLDRLWHAAARRGSSDAETDAALVALLDDLDVPRALALAEEAGGRAVRALAGALGLS